MGKSGPYPFPIYISFVFGWRRKVQMMGSGRIGATPALPQNEEWDVANASCLTGH